MTTLIAESGKIQDCGNHGDAILRNVRKWDRGGIVSARMIQAIRWYQVHISAGNPACCKYYPSCSNYALQAIERYGAWRGGLLAALRLLRCRPWSLGGIDDVPQHYSLFYRLKWSKAHEEPRLTPLNASQIDGASTSESINSKSSALKEQVR